MTFDPFAWMQIPGLVAMLFAVICGYGIAFFGNATFSAFFDGWDDEAPLMYQVQGQQQLQQQKMTKFQDELRAKAKIE